MSDITLNPKIRPGSLTPAQVEQTPPADTPESTSPSYTPLWMVNDSVGSNALEMLGMRRPNSVGDLAAILAEVSLTLEKSIDQSDKNKALSGFARMFASLGAYGLNALREMIVRSEGTNAAVQDRVDGYNKDAAPKLSQLSGLNASIAGYDVQISNLNSQITVLEAQYAAAKDADKKPIGDLIDAAKASLQDAKNGRDTALSARKQVETDLANLQIDTLSDQLDDLKAQLAKAPEGTAEATTLKGLVDDLTGRLATMKADLAKLPNETYATRSDSPLYADISANFAQGFSAVEDGLTQLLVDGRSALTAAAQMVMAIAAQTAAAADPTNVAAMAEHGARESEVEDSFEAIADELDAAAQRMQAMLQNFDKATDAKQDRIDSVARALLAAISDILAALDGVDDAAGGAPPAGPTVGNRLRIGI